MQGAARSSTYADPAPEAIPQWTRVELGDKAFEALVRLVHEHCGITLSSVKKTMLETRLRRRLHANGLDNFDDYVALLRSPTERGRELQGFVDTVVTNETSFFRERTHFDYLDAAELDRLVANAGTRQLRAWSAACSSGQEVYTLAMVLDAASEGATRWDWNILATDISVKVLTAAREAIYRAEDVASVPQALRDRYVLRSKDPNSEAVRMAPELRQRVQFGQLNLMHNEYHVKSKMDVIFLRNVLIYFEPKTQEAVVAKLCRHLRPGGLLFLGHSDTTRSGSLPLRLVRGNIYQRLED
ncbi:CheR family methyltransferase [Aureimonas ureilytica]|uniref:CheR family methyltransferase n=1 Tax=Aureimonas ureilytica TaxID=401562 RepID=UPI0003665BAF|nr:protein-glutamate O-methyltransferase CheR [Aureimonas ureilytica]